LEPLYALAAYIQNRTVHIQMNVHWALHLHNVSGSIWVGRTLTRRRTGRQILAVSGTADAEPGYNSPRLLPVPSAWWKTPAVTSCVLTASPESARAARHFTREILLSWGCGGLVDEAETIIGELVVNAVQHGTSARTGWQASGLDGSAGHGYPRAWARNAWATQQVTDPGPEDDGATDPDVLKLCLLPRSGEVMLAVIDASDDAPTPREPDWVRESGRGLQIVHALSSVWGWSPIEGHGKAVWAVLPLDLLMFEISLLGCSAGAESGQPRAAASC
jgi:Histidine kinase-like ATPase domain